MAVVARVSITSSSKSDETLTEGAFEVPTLSTEFANGAVESAPCMLIDPATADAAADKDTITSCVPRSGALIPHSSTRTVVPFERAPMNSSASPL